MHDAGDVAGRTGSAADSAVLPNALAANSGSAVGEIADRDGVIAPIDHRLPRPATRAAISVFGTPSAVTPVLIATEISATITK